MEETLDTGVEELEVAEPTTEESEEEQEVAEPAEEVVNKTDSAFADLRRKYEEADKRAKQQEEALGLFFDGDDKIAQAYALKQDKTPEEVKAEFERQQAIEEKAIEIEELRQENMQLKVNQMVSSALGEVKRLDPNIKSLEELGQDFVDYITAGLPTDQAYYAIKAKENMAKVKTPTKIGEVNATEQKKDFFTREEVLNMTDKQLDENYDTIRKCQSEWH